MSRLFIPAIHLPRGREVFRPFPYRPSQFRKVLKAYAHRSLLMCAPGDVTVLPSGPDSEYLDFLLSIGRGTQNIIVCSGNEGNFARDILDDASVMEKLRGHSHLLAPSSFYIHLEEEMEIARKLGRPETVCRPDLTRMFNTLYYLVRLEEDLGLNAIPRRQLRCSRFAQPALAMLKEQGPLFVRGNESVGGSQVHILKTEADVDRTNRKIARNRQVTRYFVSKFLDVAESWNVQYDLCEDTFEYFGASRQTLDGGAHTGNIGGEKPPSGVVETAEAIVERLHETGALGIVGVDLIVHEGEAHAVEINPRLNTSTPVLCVNRELFGGKAFFRTFSMETERGFDFGSFIDSVGKENLLDPARMRGYLPYHFEASGITGRIDVAVFAKNPDETDSLMKRVRGRL